MSEWFARCVAVKWSSVLSRERSEQFAVEEALESLAVDLQGEAPDLILMFVYSGQPDQYPSMAEAIAERYPDVALVGCSAAGVVGGGHEIEHE